MSFPSCKRRVNIPVALAAIVLFGVGLRLYPLGYWLDHRDKFFHDGSPALLEVDGYYHLSLARDLAEGNYTEVSPLRGAPQGYPRPALPPLLPWSTWLASLVLPWSLEWIAALTPAILGALILFPVYGLGALLSGRACGVAAATVVVASEYYWLRSSIGWYDTDCMNVTFAASVCWAMLLFARTPTRVRYLYLVCCLALTGLFWWWWGAETFEIVAGFFLFPLIVALVFYFRPPRHERTALLTALGVVALALLGWMLWQGLLTTATDRLVFLGDYVLGQGNAGGEASGDYVAELAGTSFPELVKLSMNSWLGFGLGAIGLVLLVARARRDILFLAPLLVVGLMSIYGKRFLIFLAPVLAIGLGHLVQLLWDAPWARRACRVVAVAATASLVAFMAHQTLANATRTPAHPPAYLKAMQNIGVGTPGNAIVWASWARGYPLIYFGRRAVVFDGGVNSVLLQGVNFLPLAAEDKRFAANFLQYFANNGLSAAQTVCRLVGVSEEAYFSTLRRILSLEPSAAFEQIKKEWGLDDARAKEVFLRLYPEKPRPVYLFLDHKTFCSPWYFLGDRLDAQRPKESIFFLPFVGGFAGPQTIGGTAIGDNSQLMLDVQQMTARFGDSYLPLTGFCIRNNNVAHEVRTNATVGIKAGFFSGASFGALMDQSIYQSVFNQLFMLSRSDPRYFTLLNDNAPFFQMWEVHGDRPDLDQVLKGIKAP